MMEVGATIPDVQVTTPDGVSVPLATGGGPLVVYFYPKADTAGCTREAQDFSALGPDFASAGVRVLGISRDTPVALARFAAKHALTVPLASDGDDTVCAAFGVWGEKQLYGRTYLGVERATFLFGADGRLARAWRKVRVAGHAQAVLDAASAP